MTVLTLCHAFGAGNAVASNVAKNGGEYLVGGFIPGDQAYQSLALNNSGGYITWNDHQADNDGLGISLLQVDGNVSSAFEPLTVNETTNGDQRDAQIVMLNSGDASAVVVWEGNGDIYARYLNSDGTFSTGEILVNETITNVQNRPAVTVLSNGNVAIAWSSLGQDGSHYGVYGRILDQLGNPVTGEFGLAQETDYNQKSVSLTSHEDGSFHAVWVSEQLSGISNSIDIDGRIDFFSGGRQFNVVVKGRKFGADGQAQTDELSLTAKTLFASNPQILRSNSGELALIYAAKPVGKETDDSWDVYIQDVDPLTGQASGASVRVNNTSYGDQFVPRASAVADGYFVTWTSLGHDGDAEGVYGNLVQGGETLESDILINTTTSGRQFLSSVAATGNDAWVVSWSGFSSISRSLEIYAQKFNQAPTKVQPASVFAFSSGYDSVNVVWPFVADEEVTGYRVSLPQEGKTFDTETNNFTFSGLESGRSYSVTLSFIYQDGSTSVTTANAQASTWTSDGNGDGLPDSWQIIYFGSNQDDWAAADLDSDQDGANNLDELLAGTNPANSDDALIMDLVNVNGQTWLSWSTVQGGIYQLQETSSLNVWQNVGAPRFAADNYDAVQINSGAQLSLYRVVRLK